MGYGQRRKTKAAANAPPAPKQHRRCAQWTISGEDGSTQEGRHEHKNLGADFTQPLDEGAAGPLPGSLAGGLEVDAAANAPVRPPAVWNLKVNWALALVVLHSLLLL